LNELKAFLGLLIHMGAMHENETDISDAWNHRMGLAYCYAVMTEKRFRQFLRCLRFDDKTTRAQRYELSKTAAIDDLVRKLNENFSNAFTPFLKLSIEDFLSDYYGRKNPKNQKFGILLHLLTDCTTKYCCQFRIDKQAGDPLRGKDKFTNICLELLSKCNYDNTGRMITLDNQFTSMALCSELMERKFITNGVLGSDNPAVPHMLRNNAAKKRELYSSVFYFTENAQLTSYCDETRVTNVLTTGVTSTECSAEQKKST
jgi:hypothetical protein